MSLPAFDIQGHRGCRGLSPENTIPAMLHAIDLGVTTLELDVVITRDEEVICSHEPFFNHEITTRADGSRVTEAEEKSLNIFRMSFAETQQFDVGMSPHPRFPRQEKIKAVKPRLSELIADVEAYAKLRKKPLPFYNIETKSDLRTDGIYHPGPDRFVELVMKVVNERKIAGRTIIQSFDFRTLKVVHQRYPGVRTAALVEDNDPGTLEQHLAELGFTPDIYSPYHQRVTPSLLEECHKRGMKVIPWTVNDAARIAVLRKMGVDGIITDYPDLFISK